MTPDPTTTPRLFPDATAHDLRFAANQCRLAAETTEDWDDPEAGSAKFYVLDLGGDYPDRLMVSMTPSGVALMLEAEADRIDPPPPTVLRYTDAPEAYDGFGTRTIDPNAGVDKNGRVIRLVAIEEAHRVWQVSRYESGAYVVILKEELVTFKGFWTMREG